MPTETFTRFAQLVEEHCRASAHTLFSVATSFRAGRAMAGKPELLSFPGCFIDMGELSRDGASVFFVTVTHHGSRRLALRCYLDGLLHVSLRYDGRPVVPGMSRTIEVEADGRFERLPREWCGLLRIEGTELLPGPMTASVEPARRETTVVPVHGKVSGMLSSAASTHSGTSRASSSWATPQASPRR